MIRGSILKFNRYLFYISERSFDFRQSAQGLDGLFTGNLLGFIKGFPGFYAPGKDIVSDFYHISR